MRSYLPRLPRRRSKWQRVSIKTARGAGELAMWIGIGLACVAGLDTAAGSPWGLVPWLVILADVIGASAIRYGPHAICDIRQGRTPKRHLDQSNQPQGREWIRALNRRFRRG
jgi:hypothetical protein